MLKFSTVLVLVLCFSAFAADQAELAMQEGLKVLKEKPDDVVRAAAFFAKAADAFESKGEQAKAAEANSCLYWTRKKFTIRDLNVVTQGNPSAAKRMEKIVSEKPKVEDAQIYLDKVDEFAKISTDPLLTAIRYFEVADRFPSTDQGRKAMDASLKAMQKVSLTAKPAQAQNSAPVAPVEASLIGKWEVQWSNSSGSGIIKIEFLPDGLLKKTNGKEVSEGSWRIEDGELSFKTGMSTARCKMTGPGKFEGTADDGGKRIGKKVK